jgi:O-antigen ligase
MNKADAIWWINGWVLTLACLCLPISIVLVQFFAYLGVLIWLACCVLDRRRAFVWTPLFTWALIFVLLVGVGILTGERAERSVHKAHRLLLLLLLVAVPATLSIRPEWIKTWFVAFVVGVSGLALYDLVRIPLEWRAAVAALPAGTEAGAYQEAVALALYDQGNMRDPQFYLVALCMLLPAWFAVKNRRVRWILLGVVVLIGVSFLLHNKRGAWLAFGIVAGGYAVGTRKWKMIIVLVAVAAAALLVPQVRQRVADLSGQFDPNHGGRWELWTKAFPPFMEEHPWGVGYLAVKHEDFLAHTSDISFTVKNHFHNNGCQIAAEMGWIGLSVWLAWMAAVFTCLIRAVRRRGEREGVDGYGSIAPVCLLCAFTGLFLNGMVEYNFGDSEIFTMYCILMALAWTGWPDRPTDLSSSALNG